MIYFYFLAVYDDICFSHFVQFPAYFPLNLSDLLEDANEVQEILGRSYGVGDDIGKTFSRCSMHMYIFTHIMCCIRNVYVTCDIYIHLTYTLAILAVLDIQRKLTWTPN